MHSKLIKRLGAVAIVLAAAVCGQALAQAYPTKPVRLIVPQPPGGASDAFARMLAQKLTERWGQSVLVDNRAGAGGNIGTDAAAKAAPDGYTLVLQYEGSYAINVWLFKKLPFDSVRDFTPIAPVATVPFLLAVHASSPARNIAEFMSMVRDAPRGITYASAGNGTVNHLIGEMFNMHTKLKVIHVPYRGAGPAMTDLLGRQVDAAYTSMPSAVQYIKAGTLRALAVTSARRSEALPDVPTMAESGLTGFNVDPWFGILGPAGVPADIVTKINADVNAILRTKEMKDALAAQGATPLITTPQEFAELARRDIVKWEPVVKASGATVD